MTKQVEIGEFKDFVGSCFDELIEEFGRYEQDADMVMSSIVEYIQLSKADALTAIKEFEDSPTPYKFKVTPPPNNQS